MASSFQPSDGNLLTPSVVHNTQVPAPLRSDDGKSQWSTSEKVVATVCSEYVSKTDPVSVVEASHRICVVVDPQGQPVIFTIGTDNHLYAIRHVQGARDAWQSHDITPVDQAYLAVAFDAIQEVNGLVSIAVAVNAPSAQTSDVYFTLQLDLRTMDFSNAINYSHAVNNLGGRPISSLMLGTPSDEVAGYYAVVGTVAAGDKIATDYVVSLEPSNPAPWSIISLPKSATRVIDTVPATLRAPFNKGIMTLYQQPLSTPLPPDEQGPDVGTSVSYTSLDQAYNISILLKNIGGAARGVTSVLNPKGTSDLYVAGVNGIGYYASASIDRDPVVILPGLAFEQVVVSESNLTITVLAVTTHGQLYYVQGVRQSEGKIPTFFASGIPIHEGVERLSTLYNAKTNACEVLYVGQGSNQIVHFLKDITTSLWMEKPLLVSAVDALTTYSAYVTSVAFTSSDAKDITNDLRITLTASQAVYATVNQLTYQLDSTPTVVAMDSSGRLDIVTHADSTLAAPTYTIKISGNGHSESFVVEPTQRVLRKLGSYKTADDIRNAKTTTGQLVFNASEISDDTFGAAASVLSAVPRALGQISPSSVTTLGPGVVDTTPGDFSAGTETDGSGSKSSHDSSWTDRVGNFLEDVGDFFISISKGLLKVAKVLLKAVNGVLNFWFELEGKIIRFVLDSIGPFVISMVTWVAKVLHLDPTRLVAWLAVLFDWKKIVGIQKDLAGSLTSYMNSVKDGFEQITDDIVDRINNVERSLSSIIPDYRGDNPAASYAPPAPSGVFKKIFGFLFDNPAFRDIMRFISTWVLDVVRGVEDLIGTIISFPGMDKLTTILSTIVNLAEEELEEIIKFVSAIVTQFTALVEKRISFIEFGKMLLSDAFWTVFDMIKDAVVAGIRLIPEIIDLFITFISGHIQLPMVSAYWEGLTTVDFSILNVLTIIGAIFLEVTGLPVPTFTKAAPVNLFAERETTARAVALQRQASDRMLVADDGPEEGGEVKAEEDEEALKHYHVTEAVFGALTAFTGIFTVVCELLLIPEAPVEPQWVTNALYDGTIAAEGSSSNLSLASGDLEAEVGDWLDNPAFVPKGVRVQSRLRLQSSQILAHEGFKENAKKGLQVANLFFQTGAVVNLAWSPLPADERGSYALCKTIGLGFGIASLTMEKNFEGKFLSLVQSLLPLGNMVGAFVPGTIEFAKAEEGKIRDIRWAGDWMEMISGALSIASICAGNAKAPLPVIAGLLVGDIVCDAAAVGLSITLAVDE